MGTIVSKKGMMLGILVCFLLVSDNYLSADGRGSIGPHYGIDVTVISNGETKFIDVATDSLMLLGDLHFLIAVVLGSGELEITMEKSDSGGQLVMMTGIATSSHGASTPIFKTGVTPNALSGTVEVGNEEVPNGFLYLITGVLFSLGGVGEEGGYSIELAF